jgi:putative hydrolase of the HAD superfamily
VSALRGVAFDFGGPVLLTPFELLAGAERRLGLAPGTFGWRGPFDPQADPLWQSLLAGSLTERAYWHRRAEEFGAVSGLGSDPVDLFGFLYDDDPARLVRPVAERLLRAAVAAGLRTAVLTNDLARFHPPEWIAAIPFLASVDVVVDGSVTGVLKPDPAAYLLLLEAMGLAAADVLFIDDQAHNADAARALGMTVVRFDPTDPAGSYATAERLLALEADKPREESSVPSGDRGFPTRG